MFLNFSFFSLLITYPTFKALYFRLFIKSIHNSRKIFTFLQRTIGTVGSFKAAGPFSRDDVAFAVSKADQIKDTAETWNSGITQPV